MQFKQNMVVPDMGLKRQRRATAAELNQEGGIEPKLPTCGRRAGSYLMEYDSFGETFKMKLDAGQAALPSIMGTILSLLSFLIVLGYTVQKFDILITRKDVDVAMSVEDTFFAEGDKFTGSQGFNVAIALVGFGDKDERNYLRPEYANIKFEFSDWDVLANQTISWNQTTIESHASSEAELGLTGDHTNFMPIHETSIDYVKLYKNEFVCLDKHDLEIWGNFN